VTTDFGSSNDVAEAEALASATAASWRPAFSVGDVAVIRCLGH
jgi:hypothetical protein